MAEEKKAGMVEAIDLCGRAQFSCPAIARKMYEEAGEIEARLLGAVQDDKIRTRSIQSTSVASLFYKADLFERVKEIVPELLSHPLEAWAVLELRKILDMATKRSSNVEG